MSFIKNNSLTLLILTGIALLSPYLIIAFFVYPAGDDFCYASLGGKDFNWEAIINERQRWNGRYFSNILVVANPIRWGWYWLYPVFIIAILLSYLFALILLIKLWIKNYKVSFLVGLISFLITLSLMPSINEGVYWYTSSSTYLLSVTLFLFWLKINFIKPVKFILMNRIAAILLMIAFSGFNEIIILINIGFLIFRVFGKPKDKIWTLTYLAIQLGLFYYVWSAPGNEMRLENFQNNHDLINTVKYTFLYSIRFLGEWLISPPLIIGIILLFFSPIKTNIIYNKNSVLSLILLILITVIISCAAPIWSTGILGQYRTPNLSLLIITPQIILLILHFKSRFRLTFSKNYPFKYLWLFLLFISLFFWKNAGYVISDLYSGKAIAFYHEQKKREELIKKCAKSNTSNCSVPKIQSKPKSIFIYDLSNDSSFWMNHCAGNFYGVKKINTQ